VSSAVIISSLRLFSLCARFLYPPVILARDMGTVKAARHCAHDWRCNGGGAQLPLSTGAFGV